MDFFGAQDQARAKTRYLVLLFILGVSGIVGSIYVLFALLTSGDTGSSTSTVSSTPFWRWDLFIQVAIVVCGIIFGASFFKTLALKAGGSKVAESVGGRKVALNTTDPKERRLLNIVEEMSIASGVPMPEVFILDQEKSINAFAAGYNPGDAAVAVTRGTLDQLNRDELQGVIAHEFSHILSGDMRINIRLMGIIFGIFVISVIGRILFRNAVYRRAFSSNSKNDGGRIGILAVGAAIMAIGWIGVIFGRLIQAAISRQREYLADSSAVQFTRNPDGIAGALRKIGGLDTGSKIGNPHAEEVAHMFFAQGLSSLFATHPPLAERIAAIQPDGVADSAKARSKPISPETPSAQSSTPAAPVPKSARERSEAMLNGIGVIAGGALARAAVRREALHKDFGQALEQSDSAVALAIAFLIDDKPDIRARQFALVRESGLKATTNDVEAYVSKISPMSTNARFTALDIAVAPLRGLSQQEAQSLERLLSALADADNHLTLDEFLTLRGVRKHLKTLLDGPNRSDRLIEDPAVLAPGIGRLLSYVASTGTDDEETAATNFRQAVEAQPLFNEMPGLDFAPPPDDLRQLEPALETLSEASYRIREAVIRTATTIALADDEVQSDEVAILRAIAISIGIPVPPLDDDPT